jgi:hypothetical protein
MFDDEIHFRCSKKEKRQAKKNAERLGFRSLGDYFLAMDGARPTPTQKQDIDIRL